MNNVLAEIDEYDDSLPTPAAEATVYDRMGTDELRECVAQRKAQQLLSMPALARAMGLGESTVQSWMNRTYKGSFENVAGKVRIWLNTLQANERLQAGGTRKIEFVRTGSADEHFTLMRFAQSVPTIVTITGGAGVGKTTSAEQYQRANANVWHLTLDPQLGSAYAVLDYLADELQIHETTPHKRSRAIAQRVRDTGGLLIIDEAQHATVQALEQLRAVHDRAKVGIALIGNDTVWSRIDGGGRRAEFAQLFSRVGMQKQYAQPTKRDIADILNACEVVDGEQRRLLATIAAKPGALRQMLFTLNVAQRAAGTAESVTVQHLEKAYAFIARGGAL